VVSVSACGERRVASGWIERLRRRDGRNVKTGVLARSRTSSQLRISAKNPRSTTASARRNFGFRIDQFGAHSVAEPQFPGSFEHEHDDEDEPLVASYAGLAPCGRNGRGRPFYVDAASARSTDTDY
jgi:hypothetical protein